MKYRKNIHTSRNKEVQKDADSQEAEVNNPPHFDVLYFTTKKTNIRDFL